MAVRCNVPAQVSEFLVDSLQRHRDGLCGVVERDGRGMVEVVVVVGVVSSPKVSRFSNRRAAGLQKEGWVSH